MHTAQPAKENTRIRQMNLFMALPCESVEAFQSGFGPHANEIMADIPNYTDLTPIIQISDVVGG